MVRQPGGRYEPEGRYALIVRWAQADARWKMYHNGEIGEPFDVLGWFAADFYDANSAAVSPELLLDEVQRLLARCDNTREPWKVRMRKAAEHNLELRRKQLAELKSDAAELAADAYYDRKHGPGKRFGQAGFGRGKLAAQ